MKIGDVVKIFAPTTGYNKYHFCVCVPEDGDAGCFLFLNSNPNFRDCLAVDCARIAFLPASQTGVTAISFSIMMRYNKEKLQLFKAEVLGEMPKDVLAEMMSFMPSVTSLPSNDKATVIKSLRALLENND